MQANLELTHNNVKRLMKGYPTQLKKEQLQGTKHYVKVHPLTHQKITTAKMKNKGIRLSLTPQELAESGEGFKDLLAGFKKGLAFLNRGINSDFYQSNIRPVVRKIVDEGANIVKPLVGPVLSPAVDGAINIVSDKTKAFGIIEPTAAKTRGRKPKAKVVGGSFLIN